MLEILMVISVEKSDGSPLDVAMNVRNLLTSWRILSARDFLTDRSISRVTFRCSFHVAPEENTTPYKRWNGNEIMFYI